METKSFNYAAIDLSFCTACKKRMIFCKCDNNHPRGGKPKRVRPNFDESELYEHNYSGTRADQN
jgi:hypothetical protein